MSEAVERLRKLVIEKALHGPGKASGDARRAAFDDVEAVAISLPVRALVAKVAANAWKVTDEDVDAAKQAGLSDDQIFELVVCASLGTADRQLEAALAALEGVDA